MFPATILFCTRRRRATRESRFGFVEPADKCPQRIAFVLFLFLSSSHVVPRGEQRDSFSLFGPAWSRCRVFLSCSPVASWCIPVLYVRVHVGRVSRRRRESSGEMPRPAIACAWLLDVPSELVSLLLYFVLNLGHEILERLVMCMRGKGEGREG